MLSQQQHMEKDPFIPTVPEPRMALYAFLSQTLSFSEFWPSASPLKMLHLAEAKALNHKIRWRWRRRRNSDEMEKVKHLTRNYCCKNNISNLFVPPEIREGMKCYSLRDPKEMNWHHETNLPGDFSSCLSLSLLTLTPRSSSCHTQMSRDTASPGHPAASDPMTRASRSCKDCVLPNATQIGRGTSFRISLLQRDVFVSLRGEVRKEEERGGINAWF